MKLIDHWKTVTDNVSVSAGGFVRSTYHPHGDWRGANYRKGQRRIHLWGGLVCVSKLVADLFPDGSCAAKRRGVARILVYPDDSASARARRPAPVPDRSSGRSWGWVAEFAFGIWVALSP